MGCQVPEPFQTAILGAFQRRSETLEALIPQLYVKGLSDRDISDTFKQVLEDEGGFFGAMSVSVGLLPCPDARLAVEDAPPHPGVFRT